MRIITITTDAWFSYKKNIATYSYRIRWDNLLLKWSWIFKKKINWSTWAERWAIQVALRVLNKNLNQDFDLLIINRDNVNANKRHFNNELNELLNTTKNNFGKKKRKVQLVHVKAHSWTATKKTFVHDWCDKECKKLYTNIK